MKNKQAVRLIVAQPDTNGCSPMPGDSAATNETERIQSLNGFSSDLKSNQSLEKKLQYATEKARVLTSADVAFVCLADKTGENHKLSAVSGDMLPDNLVFELPAERNRIASFPGGNSTACTLIDLQAQDPDTTVFSKQLDSFGIQISIAVPLQVKNRHHGYLFAGSKQRTEIDQTERCLLSLIGNLLSAEIDRKRAEEDQIRLETVLEQAAETIMITDRNGVIQYVNPCFETVSGYRRREVIGKQPDFLRSGQHDADFYKKMWDTIQNGKIWRGHLVNKRKNGSTYELDATISPVKNDAGEITHYVSVRKDVTQEAILRKQLYQAQKMEAIGTLAGGIAHDFNNLMMGIQGSVSLMQMDMLSRPITRKRCEIIESYIKKGADLTRQLLGIARGGRYQQVPTDLTKLVNANLKMFGRTKKEIQIHFASEDRPCIAEVDPGQIDQVLLNLFVNAWQAMPNGGNLYVDTNRICVGGRHSNVPGLNPGDHIKIVVRDTGMGISKEILDKIFDPFFTTKGKSRGTGLGLASAYGIINNHHGLIQARSETGKGATFEIYLPASDKSSSKSDTKKDNLAKGRETILLVDDEAAIIDICREMLTQLGYRIISATTGDAAVSIFEKRKNDIDLVILDLIMPKMSGGEVYDRITALKPGIKVLLASGYALNDQVRETLSRGAGGFIQKPYTIASLSQKVRQILSKS